ncbi:MAG: phosphatidylglycerophosphatase A [Balneolales bacterium]|nr:phosphatidylglycerophosphatase A [Balneolales bacterium]
MKALKLFIGAGFGSGYIPFAPGTVGSLAAIPIIYALQLWVPLWGAGILVVLASLLTLWVAKECEMAWGEDPGKLVMDEFAGQGIVFAGFTFTGYFLDDWMLLLAGFLLFRIFDIWKPLGIDRLQKLGGGTGILLDDLLAGFYAFLSLKTLILLIRNFF